MAEKDTILKEKIKYAGYGDFRGTYNFAYNWFKEESYSLTEDKYIEKIKGEAKDVEILWTTSKKITDYFKSEIAVKWKITGLEEVTVEIDGKKKKMNKYIELEIEIKGVLVKDYDSKWNKNATTKFFKEVYNKYVIPSRTEEMKEKVESDVQDFKEELKALLELTGKRQN